MHIPHDQVASLFKKGLSIIEPMNSRVSSYDFVLKGLTRIEPTTSTVSFSYVVIIQFCTDGISTTLMETAGVSAIPVQLG